MIGKRVLLVGDFRRSQLGDFYYNTNFVLNAGLVRAGCHVLCFSDRDTAREATVLGRKALGRTRMNRKLVECSKVYQPDLVLFGHADMTMPDTFAAIRKSVPGVRLAQFNVDALFRLQTMARFRARGEHMDVSFITTAAPDGLKALAARPLSVAFFPNPVDAGLARNNAALMSRAELSFDAVFLGAGDERREEQVLGLQKKLPDDFRFHAAGGVFGSKRVTGPMFLDTLASAAMSPNLPLDDTVPVELHYSSDRLSQLLGLGVVALCRAEAKLDNIYEDGIVNYTSIADLAEQMAVLAEDDERRRRIAATGRRIGLERTSAERVARYMLDHALGDGPSIDYGWPSALV
jgi:hypothetical protein